MFTNNLCDVHIFNKSEQN